MDPSTKNGTDTRASSANSSFEQNGNPEIDTEVLYGNDSKNQSQQNGDKNSQKESASKIEAENALKAKKIAIQKRTQTYFKMIA